MRAKRLKLRLFLEGQEVPIIAASTTCGVNQPATAAIQVIPTDDVFHLEARTLVHVFFFDLYPNSESMDALAKAESDGLTADIQKTLGNEYRLLFAGEFLNLSFTRSASAYAVDARGDGGGGRQAVLQCLDFSGYWDSAKQYFATGGANSAASKVAAFLGSSSLQFSEDESTTPSQMLANVLTGVPSSVPQMEGLLGGVIRLLEIIGGIYRGRGERFSGLNDFFAAAELRLRLSQTIGVAGKDTTSKNLFAHKEFKSWIRSTLGRNRGPISFRQIIDIVMMRIFHDYTSISAPYLRPSYQTTVELTAGTRRWKLPKDANALVAKRLESLDKTLAVGKDISTNKAELEKGLAAIRERYAAVSGKEDSDVDAVLEYSKTDPKLDKLTKAASADVVLQDRLYKTKKAAGDDYSPSAEDREEVKRVRDGYRKSLGGYSGSGTVKKDITVMDRLQMQVFKPNIYFCAPPRCNVLFPDLYSSFSYRRSFLEEVTRLELQTAAEYDEDAGESHRAKYYAPNIELAQGSKSLKRIFSSTSAKNGTRFLMPHEKFTGIIPTFQQMADITAFQKVDAAQGSRGKIPYQQRTANFMFFDQRFGPRQASVSCPFNPYIVAGMPMLIIDKHVADSVRASLGVKPTQFLGVPQSISHTVGQQGGSTTLSLSHCRTHNERVEHLGGLIHTFREVIGSSIKTLAVNITELDKDLGSFFAVGGAENPMKHLGIDIPGFEKAKLIATSIDRGGLMTKDVLGEDLSETVVVGVAKTLTRQKSINVPLDKALFPPWFAPIYSNINIGRDFYKEMFGVGSICDPVQFRTGEGETGGSPYLPDTLTAREANALADKEISDLRDAAKTALSTPDGKRLAGPSVGLPGTAALDALSAEIQLGMTVEEAVDALVKTYSDLKETGYSFDEFYRAYAWRPVATLTQVLGSPDFDIAKAEKATGPVAIIKGLVQTALGNSSNGTEGFHSRAFGPFDALEHLDHTAVQQPGNKGLPQKVDPGIDPRGDRYRLVQAYAAVLQASRGLLG